MGLFLLDCALAFLSLTARKLESLTLIRPVDIRIAFQAKQILFGRDCPLELLSAFSLQKLRQIVLRE